MSVFHRCDRCGKEARVEMLLLPRPAGHVTRFDCWMDTVTLELCADCIVGYRAWYMNNKEYA